MENGEKTVIGVSGCLAGLACRYDGQPRTVERVREMVKNGQAIPFCPECMAGLPIPRTPSEIEGGDGSDVLAGRARVLSSDGEDRTRDFIRAAHEALAFCRKRGIREVWLKSKSPSCGVGRIYDGAFAGRLRPGAGVTAALLMQNGIKTVEIDE